MAAPVPPPAKSPAIAPDWPAKAADQIVVRIAQVKDKSTGPLLTVTRGVVYGLFASIVGSVVLVLVLIFAIAWGTGPTFPPLWTTTPPGPRTALH